MAENKQNSLSGISIGLGILVTGFILAFWLDDVLGPATAWVAGVCLAIGIIGSIIELTRVLDTKLLGWDNLGIGLVLLAPCYLVLTSSEAWNVWLKYPLNTAMVLLLMLAIAGIADGLYKTGKAISFKKFNLSKLLKTLALFVSLIGSSYGLLVQFGLIN